MKNQTTLVVIGHTASLFLAISYSLCVLWGLALPDYAMHSVWQKLLPGFEWLSWPDFFLGLVESWAYGWYFALITVPVYHFVTNQQTSNSVVRSQ